MPDEVVIDDASGRCASNHPGEAAGVLVFQEAALAADAETCLWYGVL